MMKNLFLLPVLFLLAACGSKDGQAPHASDTDAVSDSAKCGIEVGEVVSTPNRLVGKGFTGGGNGGGLATNVAINFTDDGACEVTSDFYQAFPSPVTVRGTYVIIYDKVEVKCQPEGFETPIVWRFEIKDNATELSFDNSDPSEAGTIGQDWLVLNVN